MIRKGKFFTTALMAFAIVALMTLGACSSKPAKGTLPEKTGSAVGGETPGAGTEGSGISGEQQELNARLPFEGTEALQDIHFDFDKSDIRPEAREILKGNADWMKANAGAKVQIEGHCDERGTEEYNLALGERRANAVKNYIVSLGVEADRLYTISYGKEMPLDPGHGEAAWAKNRRAHFLVTK